jgi:hypothetical protein
MRLQHPRLFKILYQIGNWRAHWRAFWYGAFIDLPVTLAHKCVKGLTNGRLNTGYCRAYGRLNAKLIVRREGAPAPLIVDLGCLAKRVVTTAFVNYLRDDLTNAAGGADISTFKYHASGTGTGAEAVGDTALGTEVTDNARTVGTQDNGTSKHYKSVGTISYTGAHAITEHGLFSASTVGTLLDRSVFSAINVDTTVSIQFTYDLTISDGG